jgi:hypothetical protein
VVFLQFGCVVVNDFEPLVTFKNRSFCFRFWAKLTKYWGIQPNGKHMTIMGNQESQR